MTTSALQGPAPAKPTPRPKPFKAQGLAYSVVRGPNEAGAWYWRARGPDGAVAWTGWASRDELLRTYRVVEPAPKPRLVTVKDLVDRWLAARANDPQLNASSYKSYALRARGVSEAVGDDAVESLSSETLARVYAAMLRRGLSPRVADVHQRTLLSATRWAIEEELLTPRVLSVPRHRAHAPAVLPHTPTEAEAAAVIAAMTGEDHLAVSILAATGARLAEVTELRRRAIDLRDGWLHLDGKTGPRKFPLSPELRSLLSAYADGTDAWLFTGPRRATAGRFYRHLVATCARLGQTVFTPHGLRRMIVDRLLRSGVDIKTAAELMGHSPKVMLSHYRRVTQEDRAAGVAKAGLGEALVVPTSPAGVGHRSRHKR
ncbi:MAG: tyrosine-type recombinase/integrase [Deltaproteobacteria bacterium]|nr:tyrosine-type recombinase/integrase [Deltaproteobacteria bacterium]